MKKTVLITGGAGFIGHHTVEHFLKNRPDWAVVVLEGINEAGDLNRLSDIEKYPEWRKNHRLRAVFHDIRAPINESVAAHIGSVDYIIHLAAETFVDRSIANPEVFVDTNIKGTLHILRYAQHLYKHGVLKKMIQVGTDEVYGPAPKGVFFKEDAPLHPSNPYAASKAGADLLALTWKKTFNLPVLVTRTMNNFGERQHPDKLLGSAMKTMRAGKPVIIHGTSPAESGMRCWLHARNHADALLFLLDHGNPGEIYHIASQDELTAYQIVSMMAEILGLSWTPQFVPHALCRPGHDSRYALDDSKLRSMGWRMPIDFNTAFEKTIHWMADPEHAVWLKPSSFVNF